MRPYTVETCTSDLMFRVQELQRAGSVGESKMDHSIIAVSIPFMVILLVFIINMCPLDLYPKVSKSWNNLGPTIYLKQLECTLHTIMETFNSAGKLLTQPYFEP